MQPQTLNLQLKWNSTASSAHRTAAQTGLVFVIAISQLNYCIYPVLDEMLTCAIISQHLYITSRMQVQCNMPLGQLHQVSSGVKSVTHLTHTYTHTVILFHHHSSMMKIAYKAQYEKQGQHAD